MRLGCPEKRSPRSPALFYRKRLQRNDPNAAVANAPWFARPIGGGREIDRSCRIGAAGYRHVHHPAALYFGAALGRHHHLLDLGAVPSVAEPAGWPAFASGDLVDIACCRGDCASIS